MEHFERKFRRHYWLFTGAIFACLVIYFILQGTMKSAASNTNVFSVSKSSTSNKVQLIESNADNTIAKRFVDAINQERAKVGAKSLLLDERLNQSAQRKADDMTTFVYFAHANPLTGKQGYSYISDMGANCFIESENLSMIDRQSVSDEDLIATHVKAWMQSDAHRRALLDDRYQTTGFAVNGDFAVEHFCYSR